MRLRVNNQELINQWIDQPPQERSSHFVLPLHHPSDHLMGAGDPQQAQEANNRNLADDGKAINYEGNTPAHQGCLDQIGHSHTTVSAVLAESDGVRHTVDR
jgi:hypothetical protein